MTNEKREKKQIKNLKLLYQKFIIIKEIYIFIDKRKIILLALFCHGNIYTYHQLEEFPAKKASRLMLPF